MSDETSSAMFASGQDWLAEHCRTYIDSKGAKGHVIDLTFSGGCQFATHLLLRYRGRKSGKVYITPLLYGSIGGEVVIVASKGGADTHPSWYLNLVEQDEVEFQIATQAFRATWREPEGDERKAMWAFMVRNSNGNFDRYQATTQRVIPLIMMSAVEEIPVFTR